MLFYGGFLGASAMFGGVGGGQMPFYVRGAGDQWNVVEVDYLSQISFVFRLESMNTYSKYELKFGL